MIFLIWGAVLLVSLYSFAFAVTIWKEKNKAGAIVISVLSISILILPYFTYIK
ncbi:hypothetical protein [Mesobacillus jeotgali]|uniref:hypothetical protein n=1 Tax=Mesobacillus jeotgali TaxID=129985 RepID=UPI00177F1802|nr:hypothetical protein [Mesobacillus jeotgali]UYZ21341.1 hypothetical protein FOF60_20350 [Mesobacillus jeotgali]